MKVAPLPVAPARYSAAAVDKAIAASNRAGRRIGKKESTAIHRLLKGRHNPKRRAPSSEKFVIAARRNGGPIMYYVAEESRFSNAVPPSLYSLADARSIGRRLMRTHRRALDGYTLAIQPHYKKNPAPRESAAVDAAAARLERFSGHAAKTVTRVREPHVAAALVVGKLDGVLYSTVRDGRAEKYIHKFRSNSRPLLCASSDGRQLRIVGGRFEFTEAGIEDR